jgi:hypothetical protein
MPLSTKAKHYRLENLQPLALPETAVVFRDLSWVTFVAPILEVNDDKTISEEPAVSVFMIVSWNLTPWTSKKSWYLFIKLHGVTHKKRVDIISTAAGTYNLTTPIWLSSTPINYTASHVCIASQIRFQGNHYLGCFLMQQWRQPYWSSAGTGGISHAWRFAEDTRGRFSRA